MIIAKTKVEGIIPYWRYSNAFDRRRNVSMLYLALAGVLIHAGRASAFLSQIP